MWKKISSSINMRVLSRHLPNVKGRILIEWSGILLIKVFRADFSKKFAFFEPFLPRYLKF